MNSAYQAGGISSIVEKLANFAWTEVPGKTFGWERSCVMDKDWRWVRGVDGNGRRKGRRRRRSVWAAKEACRVRTNEELRSYGLPVRRVFAVPSGGAVLPTLWFSRGERWPPRLTTNEVRPRWNGKLIAEDLHPSEGAAKKKSECSPELSTPGLFARYYSRIWMSETWLRPVQMDDK